MPLANFYQGENKITALRNLAEHHAAIETRHISAYESEMIHDAATTMQDVYEDLTRLAGRAKAHLLTDSLRLHDELVLIAAKLTAAVPERESVVLQS